MLLWFAVLAFTAQTDLTDLLRIMRLPTHVDDTTLKNETGSYTPSVERPSASVRLDH